MKENKKIRDAARIANIPLWRIASALSISEPTLTRWLRFPLEEKKEAQIIRIIDKLSEENTLT